MNNPCSLYISQKLFSLWGKYEVQNQNGQLAMMVKGEPSLTRRQIVYDPDGKQIGSIHQVFLSFFPKFEIEIGGKSAGTISTRPGFRLKLNLEYFGWSLRGDLIGWNYDVFDQNGNPIAQIRRELWHLTDHYAIHFSKPDHALPLLLLALAVDCITDAMRNTANASNAA